MNRVRNEKIRELVGVSITIKLRVSGKQLLCYTHYSPWRKKVDRMSLGVVGIKLVMLRTSAKNMGCEDRGGNAGQRDGVPDVEGYASEEGNWKTAIMTVKYAKHIILNIF